MIADWARFERQASMTGDARSVRESAGWSGAASRIGGPGSEIRVRSMLKVRVNSERFLVSPFSRTCWSLLCENVWLSFASDNQLAQIAVDEDAPRV